MPALNVDQRPRDSLNYVRRTVATVGAALRDRASSLNIRPFNCWAGEEHRRLSRSLTASAQSLSARRLDINGTPPSPFELQQFRYTPFGEDRAAAYESWVTETYSSSTKSSTATIQTVSSEPMYRNASKTWARSHGINALYAVGAEPEEFPMRCEAYRPPDDLPSLCPIRPYNAISSYPDTYIPSWQFDAEVQLAGLLQQDYAEVPDLALLDILAACAREIALVRRRRRRRYVVDEAERRRGRVFDNVTDYTQPPPCDGDEGIDTQVTGRRLEERQVGGLVRTRRALPRSPPATLVESIPAKIVDAETGKRVPCTEKGRGRKAKTGPTIWMSMFRPVVGGEYEPYHLDNAYGRNLVPTTTTIVPKTTPSAPSAPARPSRPPPLPPLPRNTNNHPHHPHLILTTQEFPPALNRNGPGSRFPAPCIQPPHHPATARPRDKRPKIVAMSPLVVSASVPVTRVRASSGIDDDDRGRGISSSAVGDDGEVKRSSNRRLGDGDAGIRTPCCTRTKDEEEEETPIRAAVRMGAVEAIRGIVG
ncbi:MAG: hypothetical protein L6R40_005476 [Gallowayella cf. fulva]|nr:MAG: hypothetical protein L6R40_005476 [Xanthomendoza cf. fulva]